MYKDGHQNEILALARARLALNSKNKSAPEPRVVLERLASFSGFNLSDFSETEVSHFEKLVADGNYNILAAEVGLDLSTLTAEQFIAYREAIEPPNISENIVASSSPIDPTTTDPYSGLFNPVGNNNLSSDNPLAVEDNNSERVERKRNYLENARESELAARP